MVRSSDFHIISIRIYPSQYFIEKFHKHEICGIKKFTEVCEIYCSFFWEYFKKITGYTFNDFSKQYMFSTKECAEEYLHEKHGIKISRCWDAYDIYLIPKNETSEELVKWMFEKLQNKLKVKINKKIYSFLLNKKPETWKREHYKTTDEQLIKYFEPKI